MIDTCRFRLYPSTFKADIPAGWVVESGTRMDRETGRICGWVLHQHRVSGLRVYGTDGCASNFEVSLPRLRNGCNGQLLRPHEVNVALQSAVAEVGQVVEVVGLEKLTRLDLVHHFKGLACDFVSALRGFKHQQVRRKQVEYFESGLEWPGKELHIRLYDKKLELCNIRGDCQRLETELHSNMLHGKMIPTLWEEETGFDIQNCYTLYRRICSGFASRKVPRIGSVEELLHWLKLNRIKIDGICPVERFLSSRSRTTRYRLEKALNDVYLTFFEANFLAHLPEDINALTFIDCLPPALSPSVSAAACPSSDSGRVAALDTAA